MNTEKEHHFLSVQRWQVSDPGHCVLFFRIQNILLPQQENFSAIFQLPHPQHSVLSCPTCPIFHHSWSFFFSLSVPFSFLISHFWSFCMHLLIFHLSFTLVKLGKGGKNFKRRGRGKPLVSMAASDLSFWPDKLRKAGQENTAFIICPKLLAFQEITSEFLLRMPHSYRCFPSISS